MILMKENKFMNNILQLILLSILIIKLPALHDFAKNRITLTFFVLIIDIVYFIIIYFLDFVTRPLHIIIEQKNKQFKETKTNITLSKDGFHQTREKERTVILNFKAKKKKSFWATKLSQIFIKYKISLIIKPLCPGIYIQPLDWAKRTDIELFENGFKIKYYSFLSNIHKLNKTEIEKDIDFIIWCDDTVYTEKFDIFLEYGDTKNYFMNFIVKILMKSELTSIHTVNIRRG